MSREASHVEASCDGSVPAEPTLAPWLLRFWPQQLRERERARVLLDPRVQATPHLCCDVVHEPEGLKTDPSKKKTDPSKSSSPSARG